MSIRFYQVIFSPILFLFFGPVCRFEVSCSQYALICFQTESFGVALKKTSQRILYCQPFLGFFKNLIRK